MQLQETKVRKQLAHGVIVPKVKINAFLSSPLNVDKYFLPHTWQVMRLISTRSLQLETVFDSGLRPQSHEYGNTLRSKSQNRNRVIPQVTATLGYTAQSRPLWNRCSTRAIAAAVSARNDTNDKAA